MADSEQKLSGKVLLVEDSPTQREFLSTLLKAQDLEVIEAENGEQARKALSSEELLLVLLDIGLPDVDGVELCKEIKADHEVPVIIVSGRGEPLDRIVGLGAGADDYVVKPYEPLELLLRIDALTRRSPVARVLGEMVVGDVTLDTATRLVTVSGCRTALTKIEFDILAGLMEAKTAVVSRPELAVRVWGSAEWLGDGHALNVHVANLKKKLVDSKSAVIEPVRGVGYRLVER